MEAPTQVTLPLMTYPLSMESVKVHLDISLLVRIGFLYILRTVLASSSLQLSRYKNCSVLYCSGKAEIKIV